MSQGIGNEIDSWLSDERYHDHRVVTLVLDLLLVERHAMELRYRQADRPGGTHILEGKPCGFMMISGTIP